MYSPIYADVRNIDDTSSRTSGLGVDRHRILSFSRLPARFPVPRKQLPVVWLSKGYQGRLLGNILDHCPCWIQTQLLAKYGRCLLWLSNLPRPLIKHQATFLKFSQERSLVFEISPTSSFILAGDINALHDFYFASAFIPEYKPCFYHKIITNIFELKKEATGRYMYFIK